MKNLLTRALRPSDLSDINRLAREARAEGFHFLDRFLADLAGAAVQLDGSAEFFLGVFWGDELIALGGITPDPYVDDGAVGRLRHVFVAPAARRRGIGRQLVSSLEERAWQSYDRLRLRTDTVDASAFYAALGYASVAEDRATHSKRRPINSAPRE